MEKKNMRTAFDIETMRNGALINSLPEPEVKLGNLKDETKIKEKIAEAKAEQVDRMALNPLYGRVCAAVFVTEAGDAERIALEEDSDTAETILLERVFEYFQADCRIITYNGNGFDLPFIYRRAVALNLDIGLAPTLSKMTAKNSPQHLDLMTAWAGFGGYEKLDTLGKFLIGSRKIEIDFHDFPELIKTGAGRKKLLDYCEQDVRLTMCLHTRCHRILF
jgi:DNA polymerase elongation subunit (family B)